MDGIIFDIDGTLWNSSTPVLESWNIAISEHIGPEKQISAEFLAGLFGLPMDKIAAALFPDFPKEEQLRLGEICFDYENRYLETHPGILYSGVSEAISSLAEKYKLYIVSNCQCGYIDVFLKTSGLSSFITDYLCYGDTKTSKGQTIRTLMKKNNLEDVVYVGDTQGDANACKEANVPFIFVTYGFGEVPDAEVKIDNLTELENVL
ncbi:MAG: HAD family hydrolase [Schaedlerella sp.]|nr:HAD family hydrolase [Schaedlerella sp.]